MPRKQVSLQQMLERLEQFKATLHNNKESQKKALAFKNYAAVRFFARNVVDMLVELRQWCNMLERSGAIVENMQKALMDFEYAFEEAFVEDLERNRELCLVKYVRLPSDYSPDSLINAIERFKQLFYDREVFRYYDENELFRGYDWFAWRRGTPIANYALQCFIKAAVEEDVGSLPIPSFFYDEELVAVIADFYGWLEILPLSDWQYEELCRRGEISKDNNESGE